MLKQGLKPGLKFAPLIGKFPVDIRKDLKILLLSDGINSLTQRVQNALIARKVKCRVVGAGDGDVMVNEVNAYQPDLIVCPYMVSKIPSTIYNNKTRPCLIVHPGIVGDRGASSLDWAILKKEKEWGVTVLQAEEEMDAGDVWSTAYFDVPSDSTKTGLYKGCVSDAAVKCVLDAVSKFSQNIPPIPLHELSDVEGTLRRNMTADDRIVDWNASSEDIELRVRMSDTRPGALGLIGLDDIAMNYRLFDAHLETGEKSEKVRAMLRKASPGEVVAQKHKSLLIKGGDEHGVWIGQLKKKTKSPAIKLPATMMLKKAHDLHIPHISDPCSHDDIRIIKDGPICYVYFDFYNGAMDEEQAHRLENALHYVDNEADVKVVVLMGGDRFFSTGIHLCVIENSPSKQAEAWSNINAIDDVIKSLVTMTNKASVAVLRGNAGAGGEMLAAACDICVAHKGVLLTPSYKAMNLYGSEYWTYFLPRRVGHEKAQQLVQETAPLSAFQAESMGLLDRVLPGDKEDLKSAVPEFLSEIILDGKVDELIRLKRLQRDSNWRWLIEKHRDFELSQMRRSFRSTEFLTAMHDFVYHKTYKAART